MNNEQDLMCECGHGKGHHLEHSGFCFKCLQNPDVKNCTSFQPAAKPSEQSTTHLLAPSGALLSWNEMTKEPPVNTTSPYHTRIVWAWNAIDEAVTKSDNKDSANYLRAKWFIDELEKIASEKEKRIQQLEDRVKELEK